MIRRGPRPVDKFAIIANAALEDTRLSWRARGVLAYLLSRPEGWSTSGVRLASQSPGGAEGRDAMQAVIKELKQVGYLRSEKTQDARGRWTTALIITDDPSELATAEPVAPAAAPVPKPAKPTAERATVDDSKDVGSPGVGRPGVGGPGAISKKESKTEKKEDPPSPPSSPKKVQRERLRWYPSKEYVSLAADRWPTWLDTINTRQYTIAYLDAMDAKGWKYTDDGWLKHLEWEQVELARRTRGRAYSPTGVPL